MAEKQVVVFLFVACDGMIWMLKMKNTRINGSILKTDET